MDLNSLTDQIAAYRALVQMLSDGLATRMAEVVGLQRERDELLAQIKAAEEAKKKRKPKTEEKPK